MNKANPGRSPHSHQSIAAQAGTLAEDLVRDWLLQKGWEVPHQRWRCRWGELDLIARDRQKTLAFVEVKARSQGNWDHNGLLSITPQKQTKLCKAAHLFLAEHPDCLDLFCQFDVALVSWKKGAIAPSAPAEIRLGQPVYRAPCWLTLDQYISGAFDAVS